MKNPKKIHQRYVDQFCHLPLADVERIRNGVSCALSTVIVQDTQFWYQGLDPVQQEQALRATKQLKGSSK